MTNKVKEFLKKESVKKDKRRYSICVAQGDTRYHKHIGKEQGEKVGLESALREAQRLANQTGKKITVLTSKYNVYPEKLMTIEEWVNKEDLIIEVTNHYTKPHYTGRILYKQMVAKTKCSSNTIHEICEQSTSLKSMINKLSRAITSTTIFFTNNGIISSDFNVPKLLIENES